MPNGLIEQWGKSSLGWAVIKEVTFWVKYKENPFVTITDLYPVANDTTCHYAGKLTTIGKDKFSARTYANNGDDTYWHVLGY